VSASPQCLHSEAEGSTICPVHQTIERHLWILKSSNLLYRREWRVGAATNKSTVK
jgi:hypothetical protein